MATGLNQARALGNLGNVYYSIGKLSVAADHQQRAIALHRETGNQLGEGRALDALGLVHWARGEYADAAACHEQADRARPADRGPDQRGSRPEQPRSRSCAAGAARGRPHAVPAGAARVPGDRVPVRGGLLPWTAWAWPWPTRAATGRPPTTTSRALAIVRELGTPDGEAWVLNHLGELDLRHAHVRDSIAHHRQALAIYRHTGNQAGEVAALNGLGEALLAAGDTEAARAQHDRALQLATALGDRYEQARAHAGLARVSEARGETEAARDHWHRALRLYEALAVPEADLARQRLAAATAAQPG